MATTRTRAHAGTENPRRRAGVLPAQSVPHAALPPISGALAVHHARLDLLNIRQEQKRPDWLANRGGSVRPFGRVTLLVLGNLPSFAHFVNDDGAQDVARIRKTGSAEAGYGDEGLLPAPSSATVVPGPVEEGASAPARGEPPSTQGMHTAESLRHAPSVSPHPTPSYRPIGATRSQGSQPNLGATGALIGCRNGTELVRFPRPSLLSLPT